MGFSLHCGEFQEKIKFNWILVNFECTSITFHCSPSKFYYIGLVCSALLYILISSSIPYRILNSSRFQKRFSIRLSSLVKISDELIMLCIHSPYSNLLYFCASGPGIFNKFRFGYHSSCRARSLATNRYMKLSNCLRFLCDFNLPKFYKLIQILRRKK